MAVRKSAAKAGEQQTDERRVVEAAQRDPARFGDVYEAISSWSTRTSRAGPAIATLPKT